MDCFPVVGTYFLQLDGSREEKLFGQTNEAGVGAMFAMFFFSPPIK